MMNKNNKTRDKEAKIKSLLMFKMHQMKNNNKKEKKKK